MSKGIVALLRRSEFGHCSRTAITKIQRERLYTVGPSDVVDTVGTMQDTYRITSPTVSLFLEDGRHVSRLLHKGALVKIESETFNGNRLVEVLFEGKLVMMFTQDLRSRGEKVEPEHAG
jgi:hypothetical protein